MMMKNIHIIVVSIMIGVMLGTVWEYNRDKSSETKAWIHPAAGLDDSCGIAAMKVATHTLGYYSISCSDITSLPAGMGVPSNLYSRYITTEYNVPDGYFISEEETNSRLKLAMEQINAMARPLLNPACDPDAFFPGDYCGRILVEDAVVWERGVK